MKKSKIWICLTIGILVSVIETLSCVSSDKCNCYDSPDLSSDVSYLCPPDEGGILYTVYYDKNTIEIECNKLRFKYDIDIMPDHISLGDLEEFILIKCLLPNTNFREVLEKFNITTVNWMTLIVDENSTVYNISKDLFDGLSPLLKLTVNLGIATFESNCFANLPNLLHLYLEHNGIQQINPSMLNNTPKLEVLDLSQNFISHLPDRIFENLPNLRVLYLGDNEITAISNKTFVGLNQLNDLQLSDNKIAHIEENAFKELFELVSVNLIGNKLNTVNSNIFTNNNALSILNIDSSSLEILPEDMFDGLFNLKVITLTHNNITGLPETVFKHLMNLNQLSLIQNKLKSLPNGIFLSLQNLVELNLGFNKLVEISNIVFNSTYKLRLLRLNNNRIATIGMGAFDMLTELVRLDLSHNLIVNIPILNILGTHENLTYLTLDNNQIRSLEVNSLINTPTKVVVRLNNNNISTIYFRNVKAKGHGGKTTIHLLHNPIICDCSNFNFIKYNNGQYPSMNAIIDINIHDSYCTAPIAFKNVLVKDVKPEQITCPLDFIGYKGCPRKCFCEYKPYIMSAIVNCSKQNLIHPPPMGIIFTREPNLKHINSDLQIGSLDNIEVHLEGNALETAPYHGLGYENVTKLFLSNNLIKKFSWVPPKVKVLALDGNKLNNLDSDIVHVLNNSITLTNLTLYGNPWSCDCSSASLQDYLRNHHEKVNSYDVVCEDKKLLIAKEKICILYTTDVIMVIVLPILVILCVGATVAALYFYYQLQIKVWLYANNLCLWFVTEDELDKDKTYDIFLSFSHKDEDFVMQHLLPALETGPNTFKICIHVRDWVVGEFIATQVTRSVLDSRRTLVVLSENFLESVWGKMEFKTAHTQAIKEGRARVLVIKYGNLNEENLDEELKSYIKTNTYVEWGDTWFWDKLNYALPHKRKTKVYSVDQIQANIIPKSERNEHVTLHESIRLECIPPAISLDRL